MMHLQNLRNNLLDRERERDRDRERQRQTERDRQRQTETDRERDFSLGKKTRLPLSLIDFAKTKVKNDNGWSFKN